MPGPVQRTGGTSFFAPILGQEIDEKFPLLFEYIYLFHAP
jgi:hypothetical protein